MPYTASQHSTARPRPIPLSLPAVLSGCSMASMWICEETFRPQLSHWRQLRTEGLKCPRDPAVLIVRFVAGSPSECTSNRILSPLVSSRKISGPAPNYCLHGDNSRYYVYVYMSSYGR